MSIDKGMDIEEVVCIYTHTHTHTMEYYSAIKKNEIMPFVATWVDLEIVILSEVSQTEEKYNIPYMWNLKRINANELTSENYLQIERMNHGCWGKAVEKVYLGSLEGACTHCCCSAPQSCPALYDPMDCSTPSFPVFYYLLEFPQTLVH